MELKDILTLILALIAIAVSLYTFYTTNQNKKVEDERTWRALLHDTVRRIQETIIDQQKSFLTHYRGDPHAFESSNLSDAFAFQLQSLARLAVYISAQIPELVSDVEFAIIANTFARMRDQQASKYWKKSIEVSKKVYNKSNEITHRRLYAQHLFRIGNIGEGREEFARALKLCSIKDDYSRNMFGTTCIVLAMSERSTGSEKSANEAFDRAAEAYEGISNERMKQFALDRLARARASTVGPRRPSVPPPPAPPPHP
jgi:hypothetical protein